MPRFYFDVYDGDRILPDEEGCELNSPDAVEHEATQTAIQLGRHWLPRVREVTVRVRNEHHRIVLALTISLSVERLEPWLGWV